MRMNLSFKAIALSVIFVVVGCSSKSDLISVQKSEVEQVLAGKESAPRLEQITVATLNSKYKDAVSECTGGTPSYECSGVLIRSKKWSPSYKFWTHSAATIAVGSVSFSYLRADVGIKSLPEKSGFILTRQPDKPVNLRCVYPFVAGIQNSDRPRFGCGFAPKREAMVEDLSSCATLAVPVVNAAAWLKNFQEHGATLSNQCSLSTSVASQFKASLEAHTMVSAAMTASPNDVLVEAWDSSKPEMLPVTAFFYSASDSVSLADAKNHQRDYYLATGSYAPVLKLNLDESSGDIFSFSETDQDQTTVAERLNMRYAYTPDNCGKTTSPAFLCSGVILRITSTSDNYDPWDHSEFSRVTDAVSFSYLRTDAKFGRGPWSGNHGFIFFPYSSLPSGKIKPEIICYFPVDGATFYRNAPGQLGCRDSIVTYPFPYVSRPCREQNIVTAEEWLVHFRDPAGSSRRNAYSCSFTVTSALNAEAVKAFNEGIRVRKLVDVWAFSDHNEFRIRAWAESDPSALPIEAFFYTGNGLNAAQIDQRKYSERTHGLFVPVVRLTLPLTFEGDAQFEYRAADQVVLAPEN